MFIDCNVYMMHICFPLYPFVCHKANVSLAGHMLKPGFPVFSISSTTSGVGLLCNLTLLLSLLRRCLYGIGQTFCYKTKVTLIVEVFESVFCVCSISPTFSEGCL